MKNKKLLFGGVALILILGTLVVLIPLVTLFGLGSLFMITRSGGQQPTPAVYENSFTTTGYQPVQIDQVKVDVGVGSPIPVHVLVSGTLPDTCAQVEYTEQRQDGSNFVITLSTIPSSAEGCVQDALPFKMAFPLNVVDLPAGTYAVLVNGARATFTLDGGGSSSSELRTAAMPVVKDDIKVDSVQIETGVGSPIPVKAVVSGNLPVACAQLGEVRLHRDGTTFFVQLVAYLPAHTECSQDSLPLRLEVPLNIVNLSEGTYEANVNGTSTTFDIPMKQLAPEEHRIE